MPDTHGYVAWEAYLFHERVYENKNENDTHNIRVRCFGACCFRWREWADAPAGWSLDWVWLHPYFRRRQHLTKAWRQFEQEYGCFHLAKPVSLLMQAFLRKIRSQGEAE